VETENKKDVSEEIIVLSSEIKEFELPDDIQTSMLEFFLKTSIPRIKANKVKQHLSETIKDR